MALFRLVQKRNQELSLFLPSFLFFPAWQKVFKHTFDVIEDYVCYVLVTVGAIALSVRLLTTLSSGDLGRVWKRHKHPI